MSDDVKAAPQEPGVCPFCAWDHPGDPPHSESCVIGRHVAFAAEAERAAIVKWLRKEVAFSDDAASDDLAYAADAIEQGAHHD